MSDSSLCERCGKPRDVCVCERAVVLPNTVRVVVLQHPQEQDFILGSVPLLLTQLERAEKYVGLSWGSLSLALGEEVNPRDFAVLYPGSLKRELTPTEKSAPFVLLDKNAVPIAPEHIRGIIALDGTWSQAKALWWRNPWLLKCARALVHPSTPSIYGKLRKEPRKEYVSTLEAVALTLEGLGEPKEHGDALRRSFRTMLQRVRDRDKSSA